MKIDDSQWKKKLTPQQYKILREKGTEVPFTGELLHNDKTGEYKCIACGNVLFKSGEKFDSGTGWPSFYDAASKGAVKLTKDNSFGLNRIEATCSKCGGHLGHVFDDGPGPTKKRYCINSVCLNFEPSDN